MNNCNDLKRYLKSCIEGGGGFFRGDYQNRSLLRCIYYCREKEVSNSWGVLIAVFYFWKASELLFLLLFFFPRLKENLLPSELSFPKLSFLKHCISQNADLDYISVKGARCDVWAYGYCSIYRILPSAVLTFQLQRSLMHMHSPQGTEKVGLLCVSESLN